MAIILRTVQRVKREREREREREKIASKHGKLRQQQQMANVFEISALGRK
jgi:hypothetical protein